MEEGLIELCKIDAGLNAADMLTKHVGVGALKICEGLVGMIEGDKLSMSMLSMLQRGGM